jgi:hypothetical protein
LRIRLGAARNAHCRRDKPKSTKDGDSNNPMQQEYHGGNDSRKLPGISDPGTLRQPNQRHVYFCKPR